MGRCRKRARLHLRLSDIAFLLASSRARNSDPRLRSRLAKQHANHGATCPPDTAGATCSPVSRRRPCSGNRDLSRGGAVRPRRVTLDLHASAPRDPNHLTNIVSARQRAGSLLILFPLHESPPTPPALLGCPHLTLRLHPEPGHSPLAPIRPVAMELVDRAAL